MTGGGAQPVVRVVRVPPEVVAYKSRMSCDYKTGDLGMLTKMWRVVPLREYPETEIECRAGEGWRGRYPRATGVVEARYVRRGTDEGWKFHDLVEGEEPAEVWGRLDSPVVLLAPALIALLSEAQQKAAAEAESLRAERKRDAERAEAAQQRAKSERAFVKLLEGKDAVWAKRWNIAVRYMREAEHAALWEKLKGDARMQELNAGVQEAMTVPTKRAAIRRALEFLGQADSRLSSILVYVR